MKGALRGMNSDSNEYGGVVQYNNYEFGFIPSFYLTLVCFSWIIDEMGALCRLN